MQLLYLHAVVATTVLCCVFRPVTNINIRFFSLFAAAAAAAAAALGGLCNNVFIYSFDFEELFDQDPTRAVLMFWLSALLIIFCLINIFVAIILNAYDGILKTNPEANDASQFISTVIMQTKR
jgi:hypothetical protein